MSKKKIITSSITLIVLWILSYILIKLFYPTYINYRFREIFNNDSKEILALYNTKEIDDYLTIIKLTKSNIAKNFLKTKIDNFYYGYPFILGWKKILLWLKKINIEDKKNINKYIYKFSKQIVSKYSIIKKTEDTKIYWWFPLYKLKKQEFCILRDLKKDYLIQNKIWNVNLIKDLATLSSYNEIFWSFLWKKDVCLKYISNNSFIMYLKTNE